MTAQLQAYHRALESRFEQLEEDARSHKQETNAFVRKTSELVSGANHQKDSFEKSLFQAERSLQTAYQALQRGELSSVSQSLKRADNQLALANSYWNLYLETAIGGGDTIATGARLVRNGSAAFVATGVTALTLGAAAPLAGGLATSGGMHGGVLSIPMEEEAKPVERKKEEAPTVEPTLKKKEQPPDQCIPPDVSLDSSEDYKGDGCKPTNPELATLKLERRIARAVREKKIDPKTVKKDTKVLISEARQALREWQQDPSVQHQYGRFFLQTESPDQMTQGDLRHLAELQEQWERNVSTYESLVGDAPQGKTAEILIGQLFDDYLTLYVRGNAKLTNFLDGRGGNCEAQTKLITAAMASGKVQLPSNQRLAVQLFQDHMQAVVYNSETGEIHNLLTGKTTTEVEAPLYDPHIFHHAYLTIRGEEPPINVNDLLIVDANEEDVDAGWHPTFSSNSKLNYPAGRGYHSSGPVPAVAYVQRPSSARRRDPISVWGRSSTGKAVSLNNVSQREKQYVQSFEQASHGVGFMSTSLFDSLVFETQKQSDFYNSLESTEEKRNFLLTLTNQKVASLLGEPEIATGMELLANPSLLKKRNGKTVERAIKAMRNIKYTMDHAARVIAKHTPIPGTEDGRFGGSAYARGIDAAKKAIRSMIYERNPTLRVLETRRDALRDRVEEKPLMFVLFMDRLSSSSRHSLMDLVYYVDEGGQDAGNQSRARTKLREIVENRRVLGVGERPGRQPKVIHFTYLDGHSEPRIDARNPKPNEGEADIKNEEGQKGRKKKKDDIVDQSRASYRVKPETMIDLALKYAPERWTPALAKKFRQLNRDGRYDSAFLAHYVGVNNSYPKAQRAYDDPSAQRERVKMGMYSPEFKDREKVSRDVYLILEDIFRRRDSKSNTVGSK